MASVIDTVVNLAKRRGFVYPSGEIYGGTKSAWDFGPLGVELKENMAGWQRHLIDLSRSFLGDFSRTIGFAKCFHWAKERNAVEDNGFMLLKTASRQVAFLHAGWTEWKNTFSWELTGRDGKLQIDGLGGSYGVERLTWYQMLPQINIYDGDRKLLKIYTGDTPFDSLKKYIQ